MAWLPWMFPWSIFGPPKPQYPIEINSESDESKRKMADGLREVYSVFLVDNDKIFQSSYNIDNTTVVKAYTHRKRGFGPNFIEHTYKLEP